MRVLFHPEARKEFNEAAVYYRTQKADLDLRFVSAVEDIVTRIIANPGRGLIVESNIRRCLLRTFPYAVLYKVLDQEIQ